MSERSAQDSNPPALPESAPDEPLHPMFGEVRLSRRFVIATGIGSLLILAAGTVPPRYLIGDFRTSEEREADAEVKTQEYEKAHKLKEEFEPFTPGRIRVRLVKKEEAANLANVWGEPAIIRQSENHGYSQSSIALPWEQTYNYKATLTLDNSRIGTYRTSKKEGSLLVPSIYLSRNGLSNSYRQEYILLENRPVEFNFRETGRSLFVALAAHEPQGREGKIHDQGAVTIVTVGRSG